MVDLDEPVVLVPYRPEWAEQADAERTRVADALGVGREAIEHIGSTAVPGLIAKPVVDLMLMVDAYPPAASTCRRIEELGYEPLGEAGVPGRAYFRLRAARNFNMHVVERNGQHHANNVRLRDLLRRDADARERYAVAKRAAIGTGATQLLAYSEAKAPAIAELLRRAASTSADEQT